LTSSFFVDAFFRRSASKLPKPRQLAVCLGDW